MPKIREILECKRRQKLPKDTQLYLSTDLKYERGLEESWMSLYPDAGPRGLAEVDKTETTYYLVSNSPPTKVIVGKFGAKKELLLDEEGELNLKCIGGNKTNTLCFCSIEKREDRRTYSFYVLNSLIPGIFSMSYLPNGVLDMPPYDKLLFAESSPFYVVDSKKTNEELNVSEAEEHYSFTFNKKNVWRPKFYCMIDQLYFFEEATTKEEIVEVTPPYVKRMEGARRTFIMSVFHLDKMGICHHDSILYIISTDKLLMIEKERIVRIVTLQDDSGSLNFEAKFTAAGIQKRQLLFTTTEENGNRVLWSVELPARYRTSSEISVESDSEEEAREGNEETFKMMKLMLGEESVPTPPSTPSDPHNSQSYGYSSTASNAPIIAYDSHFLSNYNVLRVLGSGSFGMVLEAEHGMLTDRKFAVKQIALEDHDFVSAEKEVKAMHLLKHVNIVKFHDSWTEKPPAGWQQEENNKLLHRLGAPNKFDLGRASVFVYIKMELCAFTLEKWLKENINREEKQMKEWFKQLASGVGCIHEMNMFHRDLKPANILFTREGVLKVGDLGLAAESSANQNAFRTQQRGTLAYMAPEQQNTRQYDKSVDVFSMGLILAEMLHHMSDNQKLVVFNNYRLGITNDLQWNNPQSAEFIAWLASVDSASRPDCPTILADPFLN